MWNGFDLFYRNFQNLHAIVIYAMAVSDIAALHLMGNLHTCRAERTLLEQAEVLRQLCVSLVQATGLTVVGDYFHQFPSGGVTGTIVLAESHVALHTWPEDDYVTLDVFVCNLHQDNRDKAQRLFDALVAMFQSEDARLYRVERS